MDQWKIYFLLKLGIFQPAMLVYWEVYPEIENLKLSRNNWVYPLTVYSWSLLCSLFGFLGIFSSINTHYRGGWGWDQGTSNYLLKRGKLFVRSHLGAPWTFQLLEETLGHRTGRTNGDTTRTLKLTYISLWKLGFIWVYFTLWKLSLKTRVYMGLWIP